MTIAKASEAFSVGDKIQHVSLTGPAFEVVSVDEYQGDVRGGKRTRRVTVINPDNWKKVGKSMGEQPTRAEIRKIRERVQESADIWYEFFTGFLNSFDVDDMSSRTLCEKAGVLADHALEEFEKRWARKLHNECAKCGKPLPSGRTVCKECVKGAIEEVCEKKSSRRGANTRTRKL